MPLASQIEKLSGDNTRDEKERVMDALSAGLVGPMWNTVPHFLLQGVSTPYKYHNRNSVNHTHLIFSSVKAASEAWIALEEKSEEEDIDGEEEEKEEETDVETDGEAVKEVFELF